MAIACWRVSYRIGGGPLLSMDYLTDSRERAIEMWRDDFHGWVQDMTVVKVGVQAPQLGWRGITGPGLDERQR
jgi:hypothetical protein